MAEEEVVVVRDVDVEAVGVWAAREVMRQRVLIYFAASEREFEGMTRSWFRGIQSGLEWGAKAVMVGNVGASEEW